MNEANIAAFWINEDVIITDASELRNVTRDNEIWAAEERHGFLSEQQVANIDSMLDEVDWDAAFGLLAADPYYSRFVLTQGV